MSLPELPRVRSLELMPLPDQEEMFALRDPFGISATVALPMAAAILVTLINGQRNVDEIGEAFERETGNSISSTDVQRLLTQLDELLFLDNDRFAQHQSALVDAYRELDVRPAAHAGGAYAGEAEALKTQLGQLFTCKEGPGLLPWEGNEVDALPVEGEGRLCGLMSPHIDFHRGGPAFAWAYDRLVTESDAELFVLLGTAHTPLAGMYSVSRKHFNTPLGTVQTDREFVDQLQSRCLSLGQASDMQQVFDDEMPHRSEHSIEFQALMLQYIFGGRRDYQIVPILVGSFHPFVQENRSPSGARAVADFVLALRETIAKSNKKVCLIAGVDLAHIGRQFGDQQLLSDERLKQQWADDQHLLAAACEGDPEAWFIHVAAQQDRNRICGLAPTYTMLETLRPERGELLKYDQAVADDRTSCVSFASAAFYV